MSLAMSNKLQGNNPIYEPTWLRDIRNAQNQFDLQLVPEGIKTLQDLIDKANELESKIRELGEEARNVKDGERIKERAFEIIRERAEANSIKDKSLKDGDWESRVEDFASLNCLLDMKADDKKSTKTEVREAKKDKTPVTERVDDLVIIQEKLDALNGLLDVFEEGSEEYSDAKEKIEAVEILKSIYK